MYMYLFLLYAKENRKIIVLLEPKKTRVVRMYHQLWMDYLFFH